MMDTMPKAREAISLSELFERINNVIKRFGSVGMKATLSEYGSVAMVRTVYTPSKWDTHNKSRAILLNDDVIVHNSRYQVYLGESEDDSKRDTAKAKKYTPYIISSFSINQLPTCCACGVLSSAHVTEGLRKRGIGTLLHKWRLHICESVGNYSLLVCSVVTGKEWWRDSTSKPNSSIQESILEKAGWTCRHHVYNPKSGNNVAMYSIGLRPSEEE